MVDRPVRTASRLPGFTPLIGTLSTKGVLVTTSYFVKAAFDYASSGSKSVILIDSDELTRLMEEYGVAVRNYRILELKMVDTEKYDDAEG